jgi:ectoine hydroxylase-related dioxygenase (phytanoyl-CoA dioxygenase family)
MSMTLPLRPTSDLAQARRDLDEHGLCMLPETLTPPQLAAIRDELYRAADEDRAAGRAYVYDNDGANQRVWALLKRGPTLEWLARHSIAMALVEHLLERPFLLSNISANITGPGGGRMHMHADQGYVPPPFAPVAFAANAMWMVDDFTAANGATRVIVGSHRRSQGPTPEVAPTKSRTASRGDGPDLDDAVALEAPAGTLCVMDGRVWHQTGTNTTTSQRRAGIFAYYVRPFLRTQENWWRSLPARDLDRYARDPIMRELLGFDHYRSLGIVDGLPLDQTRG